MRHPVRPAPALLLALVACSGLGASCSKKKSEPTYADNVVGAMRESKAMDARGDMQGIALAVTQWVANDGNLADAPDFPALTAVLQPTWLRVVPGIDPWGASYAFSTDGNSWTLRSSGRDGIEGNEDDMVMRDGQITQMPKSFNPAQGAR